MTTTSAQQLAKNTTVSVVGGGLAGSECAWQLAERGHKVVLYEMRGSPDGHTTPAHKSTKLAELVCSNSFGSQTDYSAPGQLKWEADQLGSLILKAARESTIPAGMALGVDREVFAQNITVALQNHPNIEVRREIISDINQVPRPTVIATGPLTSEKLAQSLIDHLSYGEEQKEFLYFFDAIAPIIDTDSIDMSICWKADRNDKGTGDYINCPMDKEMYFKFIDAIKAARKIEPKEFEKDTPYFEGCMPIEAMVERGPLTPRFGPMSANGLMNPHTNVRPFAVVQLRQENLEATAYNMVGFQTKMAYGDQKEVFKMIPGLENAEFLKLGSIHRNMYIHTPRKLTKQLSSFRDPQLFFAGQITGVEGYFDSTCIGLMVGLLIDDQLNGRDYNFPPRYSALGSLHNAITEYKEHFQPTNINFSLFPAVELQVGKHELRLAKRAEHLRLAKEAFNSWWAERAKS
jgi:methylenetetrahydrofolate--tRNA-(uracil-5-)-methyltransferase